MLCATLFVGEVGVVDLEVLLRFVCASSVESVLVTLRHNFDPFWVTLFSVEPVLLALRCKISLQCASFGRVGVVDSEAPVLCCVLHGRADLVGSETRFDPFG